MYVCWLGKANLNWPDIWPSKACVDEKSEISCQYLNVMDFLNLAIVAILILKSSPRITVIITGQQFLHKVIWLNVKAFDMPTNNRTRQPVRNTIVL